MHSSLPTKDTIFFPANTYLFTVNNRNTRKRYEVCSELMKKIPERCQWCHPVILIVNFDHIAHLFLVFLLLKMIWVFLALQIFISLLDACIVYSTHLELMLNSIFPVIRMMYLAIDLVGEISTLYQRSSWHYIVSEEKTLMKNLPISYMPITYPLHTFIHRYTCMLISAWKFKWIFRMIFQYVINGFHE